LFQNTQKSRAAIDSLTYSTKFWYCYRTVVEILLLTFNNWFWSRQWVKSPQAGLGHKSTIWPCLLNWHLIHGTVISYCLPVHARMSYVILQVTMQLSIILSNCHH